MGTKFTAVCLGLVVAVALSAIGVAMAADSPPADLKKGRGSMNLSTVRNVQREVKKGKAPDVEMYLNLLGGYEGSIIDGWDERTPELAEAKVLLTEWYPKLEKQMQTCFRPDEPVLAFDKSPRLRWEMDKLMTVAAEKLTWVTKPENVSGVQSVLKTLDEECEAKLAQSLKKWQDAKTPIDAEKHPAYLRVKQQLATIKTKVQALGGAAAGAAQATADAGKQATALDGTISSNPNHEGLVPADCKEIFTHCLALAANKNPDLACRGLSTIQLARWLSLMPRTDADVLPHVQKFIADMKSRYGATEAAFAAKMEELRKAAPNDPGAYYLGTAWKNLTKIEDACTYLPAVKKGCVAAIMEESERKYSDAMKLSTDNAEYNKKIKEDSFLSLMPNMEIVVAVDSSNAKAKDLLERIKKGFGNIEAAEAKAIDAGRWIGRTGQFSGPGNADELEKSIFDYAKNGGWVGTPTNKYTVLAVAIDGNWYSHKKNIFGETIQWGLPVRVATTRASDAGTDVVKVWFLSVLTQEGASAPKAPPWAQFAVGDGYRMRQAQFDKELKK